ncbi:acyltransferase family protein [Clostridium sp. WILCCON 0269]|uniref:Acyltransferase family protein n=1 Tax=Candidatus Clostridium eludens TaxID=3381663 RepID=A0ABW8SMH0_9CLOT
MQILTGDSEYHLWYMGMILRLFIYFPIILWLAKKIRKQNPFLRVLIFIVFMLSFYKILKYNYLITTTVINFIFDTPTRLQKRLINITPLIWGGYFIIGIYIASNYEKFRYLVLKLKVLILTIFLSLFTYEYLLSIDIINNTDIDNNLKVLISLSYCVFTILFLYIISVTLSGKIKIYNVFNFISKYSYTAYMCQIIVMNYTYNILILNFHINDFMISHLILWLLVSFLAPLLIKLINYIPYTGFITGIKIERYTSLERELQEI